jgi:hypothetical protein
MTDPTNRELLERIVALEAENATLKAHLDDVKEGINVLSRGLTGEIVHINDFLWPVVHKLFPHFGETKNQLDLIVPPSAADPRADRRPHDKAS